MEPHLEHRFYRGFWLLIESEAVGGAILSVRPVGVGAPSFSSLRDAELWVDAQLERTAEQPSASEIVDEDRSVSRPRGIRR